MLKLQYFGHLMQRADSLKKTLMLGKIEGKRRREQQKMRWLDSITDLMDMSLNKLQEIAREKAMATHSSSCLENPIGGGAWWAAVHGASKSQHD